MQCEALLRTLKGLIVAQDEKQWHNKLANGRAKAGSTTLLAFLLLGPPTLLFEAAKFRARTAPLPVPTLSPPQSLSWVCVQLLFLILFCKQ